MGVMTALPPRGRPGPMTAGEYPRPTEDQAWMAGMREQATLHQPYSRPGPYVTALEPQDEAAFRAWVQASGVPFNPADPVADYDMRGYWRDVVVPGGGATQVNPNDGRLHYPDTYKTPYHRSFSAESQYATPEAPRWIEGDRLQRPDGKIVFDERANSR